MSAPHLCLVTAAALTTDNGREMHAADVGKPGECESSTAPRAPVKATTWGRVGDDGTGLPINAALVSHGPMGMGVDATCFHGYHSGVIRNCTSKGVDHAVLMVAAGTEAGVNYFTIKNSWGGKWVRWLTRVVFLPCACTPSSARCGEGGQDGS